MDLDTSNLSQQLDEAIRLRNEDETRAKQLRQRIDAAFELPRVRKWQAIIKIYCEQVPGLAEQAKLHRKAAKEHRETAGIWNPKAEMKGGDMRLGLTLPAAFLDILNTCDPEFAEAMADNGDRATQKKMYRQLVKAFPEFAVPADLLS